VLHGKIKSVTRQNQKRYTAKSKALHGKKKSIYAHSASGRKNNVSLKNNSIIIRVFAYFF
jgi:hypothetical protein